MQPHDNWGSMSCWKQSAAALLVIACVGCGRIGYDTLSPRDAAPASDLAAPDAQVIDASPDMFEPDAEADADVSADAGTDAGADAGAETAGVISNRISGVETSESGASDTFTVQLAKAPTAPVTVTLASDDTSEGTVSPASLVFTSSDWSTPQTVTVTGVDDSEIDGAQTYHIQVGPAASADPEYDMLSATPVAVSNLDDDTASLVVTPTSGLSTSESGGTATFDVSLGAVPSADVELTLESSNAAEGAASPLIVTISPATWNVPRVITLTGVDDAIADGDQLYEALVQVSASADANFASLAAVHVGATNVDDDSAGVFVTPSSGLTVAEGGMTSFDVVLTSAPTADVTILLSSSASSAGSVSPSMATFTSANWDVPQTFTITGAANFIDDGDVLFTIVTSAATSADPNYNTLAVSDVSVTKLDDDAAAIVVTPTSGLMTTELGGSASFTVRLASEPLANVITSASSTDTTEGNIPVGGLTFTPLNWNVPQTVLVTGVNDHVLDSDALYSIILDSATSGDTTYNGIDPSDVSLTNATAAVQEAYVKASNTEADDYFGGNGAMTPGTGSALSADGNTLAVTAFFEDSAATGIGGNQASNATTQSGAVYVFTRAGSTWSQQAYIKATDTSVFAKFGASVALSADGNTMAVGAEGADKFYVFVRSGGVWSQQVVMQGSNTEGNDHFGAAVALASNGNTLVVGAFGEESNATGINGNQANNSDSYAGAAYVFTRSGVMWSQQAYIKASNTETNDWFGSSVAVSGDGNTIAVTAILESSNATGIDGDQNNNLSASLGAVYVFTRSGVVWTQQAYIKPSTTDGLQFGWGLAFSSTGDTFVVGGIRGPVHVYTRAAGVWSLETTFFSRGLDMFTFGLRVAMSSDGNTLAVVARSDDSAATGINGNPNDSSASSAGAVSTFRRRSGVWHEELYVKASNTEAADTFGSSLALSGDGNTLACGAFGEDSNAIGINGNQSDNSATDSGALYVFSGR